MKNKIGTLALTGVLALTAALSITSFSMSAYAEDAANLPATGGSSIIQGDIATTDMAPIDPSATAMPNYVATTGKISSVTQDGDNYTITIVNDDMGMVFNTSEGVFVINRKDNSYMKLSDLKEGMEITGIVTALSPQTMSIPPQTPGAIGFVVNEGEGSSSVGSFDGELTNSVDMLKLNIDEKTVIVDQKGTKKMFTEEDAKNQDLLVFYTVTTRSIPAQTTPSFVMILEAPTQTVAETKTVADTKAVEPIATSDLNQNTEAVAYNSREMVALRSTAEAAGYTIEWTSNEAPVILEKNGIAISVTVGQDKFIKNGITLVAADPTAIKGSQIYIAADVADAMK